MIDTPMAEQWRDIPGYDGLYEASTSGRIGSKERVVMKRHRSGSLMEQRYPARILDGRIGEWGHIYHHLSVRGVKQLAAAHRLVLLAFVGHCPAGMEGCHNNGNPADNRPENLRWDTHYANNQDRKHHGNYATGERHPMAKLTSALVEEIRVSSEPGVHIARRLGIGTSQVSRIRSGRAWVA